LHPDAAEPDRLGHACGTAARDRPNLRKTRRRHRRGRRLRLPARAGTGAPVELRAGSAWRPACASAT
jgi:hypothetical protein